MDPILLITHAHAGGGDDRSVEEATSVLREHADVEVCQTTNPGELDGVLQRAGRRTLVVAGGDGSLHAVVAALHRRNELGAQPLGLIPVGTGNDFARTVGLPLDPAEAAHALATAAPTPMDLLVDELGEVVVNNVHVGTGAQASRHGATWKERLGPLGLGLVGYPLGAAMAAVRPSFLRLRVEIDGATVVDMDRQVLMVAVGNGASIGGGTEVTPGADPSDGAADVMVSFATGPLDRLGYALRLGRGDHTRRDDVLTFQGQQVSVVGDDFWISADGEISGPERRRTWHVEPGAYSLLVPA
ncbi:MAG TPA: diacylglycerol kinase family protein [Marmoricola sp.]